MADIDALLVALTREEKAALTAGGGMMSTVGVERAGIPQISVTDGPNGARGPSYPGIGGEPSTCIPCGSALGATWDPELVEALGALVGKEALDRGCRGLLAPTVNLHRSLLAGRNFECYSEDPLLSGRLAASYVRGVQSNGVFATVKHFVANEAEFERSSINSVVDERSLRELYLVPFEIAVRDGGALAIMTAYNRLNGHWLNEQPRFLIDLLRSEWGFGGLVMTDWFAVADSATSLGAGLDLEMPGPGRALGSGIAELVGDGTVPESDLDEAVRRLLGGLDRIGALDAPEPPVRPVAPGPDDIDLLRRAATGAAVLLVNDGTLPLDTRALRRVAVLGDHAATPRIQGGGSARVVQRTADTPLDALTSAFGADTEIVFERGCEVDRAATPVGRSVLPAPAGIAVEVFASPDLSGEVVHKTGLDELRLFVFSSDGQAYPEGDWSMRVRGTVVPLESGLFELALSQSGRARVLVDGALLLDGFENPPPPGGSDFFGFASQELVAQIALVAGTPVEVVVEYARAGAGLAGVRVGFRTVDSDALMGRAVSAAGAADVAVVFVGTTYEWETEGRDRDAFHLPGRQDELIRRVAAVNPRTVVVINAGAPVDLTWADDVGAVLQCWFGGDEMAGAVADVLTGAAEPGGRLPTTIPVCLEHSPAHDNFPGENGELRYGEGLFMGYRGYEHRCITPRFAFGHGLGYTRFEYGPATVSARTFSRDDSLTVSVPVTNVGDRAGTEVVQCYVAPESPRLARPPKELKAFAKVHLEAGHSAVVELRLDDRSFAYWDPGQADWEQTAARFPALTPQVAGQDRRDPGWQVDPGSYDLLVGRSSGDIATQVRIEVVAS
jgi:beta-glucosidase